MRFISKELFFLIINNDRGNKETQSYLMERNFSHFQSIDRNEEKLSEVFLNFSVYRYDTKLKVDGKKSQSQEKRENHYE